MAIKNAEGNYLKVLTCSADQVIGQMYKDEATRQNSTEWDMVRPFNRFCTIDLNVQADGEKTVMGNVITAGYVALKALDEFKDWEDC